jgi:hypothetical protein
MSTTERKRFSATQRVEPIQRQTLSVSNPHSYQVNERPRQHFLPPDILSKNFIVWLSNYSKETIPEFAYDLLNKITFIDTTVDCIEHIISLFAQRSSVIIIMSDDYTNDRKATEHLLNFPEIAMIYKIADDTLPDSVVRIFDDSRVEYVFNDAPNVLRRLRRDKNKMYIHRDTQLQNTKESKELINRQIITDDDRELTRTVQPRREQFEPMKAAPNTPTATSEKIKTSLLVPKGFVTDGWQHAMTHMHSQHRASVYGEITATTERFPNRELFVRDNDWPVGLRHVVMHYHPPPPSFRNVRRLH